MHTGDSFKPFAITSDNLTPLRNLLFHVAKVAEAHCRTELVHLGIGSYRLNLFGSMDTEVL